MFGLMKEADALISVDADPAVQVATAHLTAVRQELEQLEADERSLIRLVTGREVQYTDKQVEDAHRRLSIRKGTQTGWYLPEAETAREEVRRAGAAYQEAVAPARERLSQAATAKIAALTKQMHEDLEPARERAIEIEQIRHQMGDGGAKPIEHPCPALLPDGAVNFQLRNAKAKGWI